MLKYFFTILLLSLFVTGCYHKKGVNIDVSQATKCSCPICSLMADDTAVAPAQCNKEGEKTECKDFQCSKMAEGETKCTHHADKKCEEAECKGKCEKKEGCEDKAKCMEPHLKDVAGFKYLSLSFKGPFSMIPQKMNELAAFAQTNNLKIKQVLGVYHSDPNKTKPEELENEVGFILTSDFVPAENSGFKIVTVADQKMAVMVHKGPFEKVGETYGKLFPFIDEQKLTVTGPSIEFYMNCPKANAPENLLTKVMVPVSQK